MIKKWDYTEIICHFKKIKMRKDDRNGKNKKAGKAKAKMKKQNSKMVSGRTWVSGKLKGNGIEWRGKVVNLPELQRVTERSQLSNHSSVNLLPPHVFTPSPTSVKPGLNQRT